ncbi:MAG TPA: NPCBM/NEW2 domain-containing protein, partial [bacterium]|nr:NPCBM/NEW2 domain-containing protein [bacterium]
MPKTLRRPGKKIPSAPQAPPPNPAPAPTALCWLASLLLLGLGLSLTFQPILRMGRIWLRQDGIQRHKLSFTTDGVPATWGYAAWSGFLPDDLIQKFHLPYPGGVNTTVSIPPLLNQNIIGGPLNINGTQFTSGIGSHAPSKIAFDLGGKVRRFSCQVGLDVTSQNSSGVVYSVWADGKEVFLSPKLKSDADPFPIQVPVAGVKEL